jgi:unsaturated pyranuronate lyase
MVTKTGEAGYINAMDGIRRKTLVYGDKTLMAEYRLCKGKTLPRHRHPEEQTGYLVSGRIVLTIDGISHEMTPGDSWSIPGNVEHGAEIIDDSVAIEVFSPVREDFKP